jgi:hypothetical protein
MVQYGVSPLQDRNHVPIAARSDLTGVVGAQSRMPIQHFLAAVDHFHEKFQELSLRRPAFVTVDDVRCSFVAVLRDCCSSIVE